MFHNHHSYFLLLGISQLSLLMHHVTGENHIGIHLAHTLMDESALRKTASHSDFSFVWRHIRQHRRQRFGKNVRFIHFDQNIRFVALEIANI